MISSTLSSVALTAQDVQGYILSINPSDLFENAIKENWIGFLSIALYACFVLLAKNDSQQNDGVLTAVMGVLALDCSPVIVWIHAHFGELWRTLLSNLLALALSVGMLAIVFLTARLLGKTTVRISGWKLLSIGVAFLTIALDWAILLFFATPFFANGG